MYLNQYTFLFERTSQKSWIDSEEYFKEIEEGDFLQTKLYKLLIRLFSNTTIESAELISSIIHLDNNDFSSSSYYNSIESSFLLLKNYLGIKFPDSGDVIEYITQHPAIYDVTLYGCLRTREEFYTDSEISLELYKCPESSDKYLTIYVRQDNYTDDIIERMDKICDEYEDALTGQSGWLLLTTDYEPPQRQK